MIDEREKPLPMISFGSPVVDSIAGIVASSLYASLLPGSTYFGLVATFI